MLKSGANSFTHYKTHMFGDKNMSIEGSMHEPSDWATAHIHFLTLSAALMTSVEDSIQKMIWKAMLVMFRIQVWEEQLIRASILMGWKVCHN